MADLFQAVRDEVQRRFDSDKRLSTEHAQLDDNGDGRGSESFEPAKKVGAESPAPSARSDKTDGELARATWIPWRKTPIAHAATPASKP